MTHLPFFKYQATGNDFILIDNRDQIVQPSEQLAKKLCDRKFAIGSDGLILIQNHPGYDFEMVFFNPDGSQSLCGNGSRCAVTFAKKLGVIDQSCHFLAYDGGHEASILPSGEVRLKMNDVHSVRSTADGTFVDTGSPHLIVFSDDVDTLDVVGEGRKIRYNDTFKDKGVNVNFVRRQGAHDIIVRTYERGVENETLSCGTGVTASALASAMHELRSPITITTKGGRLQVEFTADGDGFTNIYLIGPAEEVFEGTIRLD